MMTNHENVNRGFAALLSSFAPYIAMELSSAYGKDAWWSEAVIGKLYNDQSRDLPDSGNWAKLVDSLDIQRCLLLFDLHWVNVFKKKLSIDNRTWAKELVGVRNRAAHIGSKDFTDDDTWRALDTMSRLAEQIDPETAEDIKGILRQSRYGSENGSTSVVSSSIMVNRPKKEIGILNTSPQRGLPSWRDVIEPHPDVAQGRYKNAEFAADLAQVARGEGALEYRDPVEFFARTFVTEGMTGLLEQSLRRICGKDGEPVIQLKTAFGGGKTHSMLALYHMMRGRVAIEKIPNVKPVLERAGVASLPKANVAVLVGTALDPTKAKRPNNMPGITINTLWGEMASQLAESAGDLKLYDIIKESDKKGVSPGSETLKTLLDACSPCLVLMDELVAYAKKLKGRDDLPAGTFDNFITFIQEITEAARASKNSIVVASIPESDIEVGGDAGKTALETIEHTFGRMESIWKPVAANEGFEVVRRRLFLNCKNPDGRDAVCTAFSNFYNEYEADFPIEAKSLDYKERMISCYPIHPEIFDRLYKDWSTLERFQRTRGVLRLMAAVVYELWMGNDASLMIMPGSIPLDVPNVRDELTRHLSENWNAIVDHEVDGKDSVPYKTDQNGRYGRQLAARRVARTIMLGSAPTSREQVARGIEAIRVRLGVVQPGENISVFSDALNTLRNALSFLYSSPNGDRFWYDDRPTLRKEAEDRAQQQNPLDVEFEIEERLRDLRKEGPFERLHITSKSSDVPDEQSVGIVILNPADDFKKSKEDSCNAAVRAKEILNNRGNTPRIYRNMLVFVAPDQELMSHLKQAVRRYLAWKSIKADSETLNLDATQNRETDNNLARSNRTVDDQIKETYSWIFVPCIDRVVSLKDIIWNNDKLSGGNIEIIKKAVKKVEQDEAVISQWAPMLLKMQLDQLLWQNDDHIEIKKLWESLCTYLYLPRLANYGVLEKSIKEGLPSEEFFAYAAGFDGTRYIDLHFGRFYDSVDRSGLLVKVDAAKKQITADEEKRRAEDEKRRAEIERQSESCHTSAAPQCGGESSAANTPEPPTQKQPTQRKSKHFFMSADLDTTRINRDVQKYVEEIIQHLTAESGAKVKVSLEVEVETEDGFSQQTVRTVSENCKTLKVRDSGFNE